MRDNDSQKIIVVGIAKTLDDAALSELFSSFGTVADAKVVLDANTQQSRGFGFVTFTSGAAMRQAIQQMDKKVVDGRTLNVRQLVPKDKFQAERAKNEPVPQDAASRPCWLLRKGKCTKGDLCPFSHETKNGEFGSCFEFMQTGECRRGAKCIFSHNIASDKAGGDGESSGTQVQETPARQQEQQNTQAGTKIKTEPTVAGVGEQKQRVCYAYQKGKCHRGKKCLYLHEKVPEMANDKPVVVAKTTGAGADVGAKRGEFEVVKVEGAGKKRSRADDSHDDDSGGDDDDDETYSKPPPLKKDPQHQTASQTKSTPVAGSKGPASHAPTPARAPRPAQTPPSQLSATQPKSATPSKPEVSEKRPRVTEENSKRPTEKRPRDTENSKPSSDSKPSEKRPRFDSNNRQPFDQREHPAAKRIYEREAKLNGPSKYGPGSQSQQQQQAPRGNKSKGSASDRFAKRAAQNNKNALQRQKRKNRKAGVELQDGHQHEGGDRPSQPTTAPMQPQRRAEKVDMGAAFDSDDERKPRGGGGQRPRVVDKAQQRANREKMQQERRAKRDAKKSALGRLQTQTEVEF